MTKTELLNYLKNYAANPSVLELDELVPDTRALLPETWLQLLEMKQQARVEAVIDLWQPFYFQFQQVIAYFKKHLESIDLIDSSRGLSLLYGVRAQSGEMLYYEGRLPVAENPNHAIDALWSKTTSELQKFYRELHNGWYYFASESMGLSSLQRIFVLSREEWGILDELPEVPVDLSRSLAIFSNGMGGYVCQELSDRNRKTFLWFHDRPPKLNLEFWPLIDSWTLIGFEG